MMLTYLQGTIPKICTFPRPSEMAEATPECDSVHPSNFLLSVAIHLAVTLL